MRYVLLAYSEHSISELVQQDIPADEDPPFSPI